MRLMKVAPGFVSTGRPARNAPTAVAPCVVGEGVEKEVGRAVAGEILREAAPGGRSAAGTGSTPRDPGLAREVGAGGLRPLRRRSQSTPLRHGRVRMRIHDLEGLPRRACAGRSCSRRRRRRSGSPSSARSGASPIGSSEATAEAPGQRHDRLAEVLGRLPSGSRGRRPGCRAGNPPPSCRGSRASGAARAPGAAQRSRSSSRWCSPPDPPARRSHRRGCAARWPRGTRARRRRRRPRPRARGAGRGRRRGRSE